MAESFQEERKDSQEVNVGVSTCMLLVQGKAASCCWGPGTRWRCRRKWIRKRNERRRGIKWEKEKEKKVRRGKKGR